MNDLPGLPVRRPVPQAFVSRPVTEFDVPRESGCNLDTIRRDFGVVELDTIDVAGAGGAMGEGAKGDAEGVEERFAGCIGDHVGGCEETCGGADDAL